MHLEKYWQMVKAAFQKSSVYRMNAVVAVITSLVFLAMLHAIWSSIAASGTLKGGLTKVMTYLLLGQVINSFASVELEEYFGERVRKGTITNELKMPVSVLVQSYMHEAGMDLFKVFTRSVPIFVIGLLFLQVQIPPATNLVAFIVTLFFSFNLVFSLALVSSMFVFWTKIDTALRFTRTMLIDFFSGVIFPLYLLPSFLQPVFYASPFQAIVDGPISVFMMETTGMDILYLVGKQVGWTLVFLIIGLFLWTKAKKKLTVQGG